MIYEDRMQREAEKRGKMALFYFQALRDQMFNALRNNSQEGLPYVKSDGQIGYITAAERFMTWMGESESSRVLEILAEASKGCCSFLAGELFDDIARDYADTYADELAERSE